MKILALESGRPGVTEADFLPHLEEEAARVWALHQGGVIRELYFRADRPEAVLLLECGGVGEAKEVLSTLPLVRAGLIDFDVVGLRAYPGFERLFADKHAARRPL